MKHQRLEGIERAGEIYMKEPSLWSSGIYLTLFFLFGSAGS